MADCDSADCDLADSDLADKDADCDSADNEANVIRLIVESCDSADCACSTCLWRFASCLGKDMLGSQIVIELILTEHMHSCDFVCLA